MDIVTLKGGGKGRGSDHVSISLTYGNPQVISHAVGDGVSSNNYSSIITYVYVVVQDLVNGATI
jgi:hypothetical protein